MLAHKSQISKIQLLIKINANNTVINKNIDTKIEANNTTILNKVDNNIDVKINSNNIKIDQKIVVLKVT